MTQRRRKPNGSRNSRGGNSGGDPRKAFERYNEMARAAELSGDYIASELYFQHADHYYRVMNERSQNAAEIASDQTNPQLNP